LVGDIESTVVILVRHCEPAGEAIQCLDITEKLLNGCTTKHPRQGGGGGLLRRAFSQNDKTIERIGKHSTNINLDIVDVAFVVFLPRVTLLYAKADVAGDTFIQMAHRCDKRVLARKPRPLARAPYLVFAIVGKFVPECTEHLARRVDGKLEIFL
jgi:hypothetical protein